MKPKLLHLVIDLSVFMAVGTENFRQIDRSYVALRNLIEAKLKRERTAIVQIINILPELFTMESKEKITKSLLALSRDSQNIQDAVVTAREFPEFIKAHGVKPDSCFFIHNKDELSEYLTAHHESNNYIESSAVYSLRRMNEYKARNARLHVSFVDIDETLLLFNHSHKKSMTILNQRCIEWLNILKSRYERTEFIVLTSRPDPLASLELLIEEWQRCYKECSDEFAILANKVFKILETSIDQPYDEYGEHPIFRKLKYQFVDSETAELHPKLAGNEKVLLEKIIGLTIFETSPVSTHAVIKAARKHGIMLRLEKYSYLGAQSSKFMSMKWILVDKADHDLTDQEIESHPPYFHELSDYSFLDDNPIYLRSFKEGLGTEHNDKFQLMECLPPTVNHMSLLKAFNEWKATKVTPSVNTQSTLFAPKAISANTEALPPLQILKTNIQ